MDSFSTLNIDALNDWVRQRNPAIGTVVEAEKFAGGQSNPTYLIATSVGNYVLRTKPGPAGKLLRSAHAIDREFRIMSALSTTDVPVPKVIDICHDQSVLGRDFFLMEYVDGRIFWEQTLPGLAAGAREAVYLEMNRALARLHSLDYRRLGLADFGTPGNYLGRQITRWTKQYRESNPPNLPAMEQLISWLPDNIPGSDEVCVIHGDYRLDNMVFAPAEDKLIAILDWELSTLGHPLVDLANHCLSWYLTSAQFRGLADFDVEALGIPSERRYLEMLAPTGN